MAEISIPIEQTEFEEKRTLQDRRCFRDRRKAGESKKAERLISERGKLPVFTEILYLIVGAVIGFVVYKATGLCDAVNSYPGHIIVGGGIIYCYLVALKHGLYRI